MVNKSINRLKSSTQWQVGLIPWAISGIVVVLAGVVWGGSFSWKFSQLSSYRLFPLFGLLAFSIMWSHYVADFLHKVLLKNMQLDLYFKVSSFVVLLAILLHPALLTYQRFRDGFGLPLGSLTSYVSPMTRWIVLLGSVSLLVFMSYELHRWFSTRRWWKYILYANDIAMLAIFYHGLRLGSQLHGGWYQVIWYIYGASLVGIFGYNYMQVFRSKKLLITKTGD